ncbi:hypothetical protein K490DRAFT_62413 [Saccharata proteae CBS 121410]|uniref:Uncharacterized protein n=1 Tax=Saccharata proteae CBS 121410 TaxID=1314787 RepID=A0A9P4HXK1_9PEZI|nr:hypothetical protein K490DRAFT_62413 [Saccharata proteae CBS 121410]
MSYCDKDSTQKQQSDPPAIQRQRAESGAREEESSPKEQPETTSGAKEDEHSPREHPDTTTLEEFLGSEYGHGSKNVTRAILEGHPSPKDSTDGDGDAEQQEPPVSQNTQEQREFGTRRKMIEKDEHRRVWKEPVDNGEGSSSGASAPIHSKETREFLKELLRLD